MSEENRQQQSSAESTVAGAAKTGKAIASIAKGAATGGAHGAAVEAAKSSKKWTIPIVAVILLSVLIIAMLPSVIFGSLLGDGTDTPNGISDDILAELKPTIEFDDGISSGTLSLDHSTIKTEAAGYKSSSYTVTATKNYTGLDRNDSSYIDKTVEKNGRTLSLSNVTWSVERTALVGDELVPATYSAVATYSGTASSTVATGYITTAEYKGTVVSSGISSILYTVTYLGTEIVPVEEEPTFNGSIVVIPVIGGTILLATLLLLGLLLRKNTTVYKATGKGNEYEKCGRLRLKTKDPELRIDRLKDIPEGMIAVEVDQAVAKKLFGQTIAIHCYDNTVEHTVGTVNGQYWFKVDIGTQEGEPDTEEEPV